VKPLKCLTVFYSLRGLMLLGTHCCISTRVHKGAH